MRIAIVGYGRMGQRIRTVALENGHDVAAVVDPFSTLPEVTSDHLDAALVEDVDVVIDFSSPDGAVDNIIMYGRLGIPAVIGTTGWYDEIDRIRDILDGEKYRILYSGNYSIGVAAFLKITAYAASLADKLDNYDVSVHEVHHAAKADSPSGTGLMLARTLLDGIERKKEICTETLHSRREDDVIHLSSERVGYVPGIHTVTLDSQEDTITLTHSARNRDGFARGAVKAASWLLDTDKEGLLSMDDFINDYLGGF